MRHIAIVLTVRFIPAYAGQTDVTAAEINKMLRFIPAYAGQTFDAAIEIVYFAGSSPHTRGRHVPVNTYFGRV